MEYVSESKSGPHPLQTESAEIDRLWQEFLKDLRFQELLTTLQSAGRGKRLKPFLSLIERARTICPDAFENENTKRQLNSSFVRRFRDIAGL